MTDNGWADLVKLIDPARAGAASGWDLQGGRLRVSPKGSPVRLSIPVAPGGSYELKLEFTRTDSFEMCGSGPARGDPAMPGGDQLRRRGQRAGYDQRNAGPATTSAASAACSPTIAATRWRSPWRSTARKRP